MYTHQLQGDCSETTFKHIFILKPHINQLPVTNNCNNIHRRTLAGMFVEWVEIHALHLPRQLQMYAV